MRRIVLLVAMVAVVVAAGLTLLAAASNPYDGVPISGGSASIASYTDDVDNSGIDDFLVALGIFLCFLVPLRGRTLHLYRKPQPLGVVYHAPVLERPG